MGPKRARPGDPPPPKRVDKRVRPPRPTKADALIEKERKEREQTPFVARMCYCSLFGKGIGHMVYRTAEWEHHQNWLRQEEARVDTRQRNPAGPQQRRARTVMKPPPRLLPAREREYPHPKSNQRDTVPESFQHFPSPSPASTNHRGRPHAADTAQNKANEHLKERSRFSSWLSPRGRRDSVNLAREDGALPRSHSRNSNVDSRYRGHSRSLSRYGSSRNSSRSSTRSRSRSSTRSRSRSHSPERQSRSPHRYRHSRSRSPVEYYSSSPFRHRHSRSRSHISRSQSRSARSRSLSRQTLSRLSSHLSASPQSPALHSQLQSPSSSTGPAQAVSYISNEGPDLLGDIESGVLEEQQFPKERQDEYQRLSTSLSLPPLPEDGAGARAVLHPQVSSPMLNTANPNVGTTFQLLAAAPAGPPGGSSPSDSGSSPAPLRTPQRELSNDENNSDFQYDELNYEFNPDNPESDIEGGMDNRNTRVEDCQDEDDIHEFNPDNRESDIEGAMNDMFAQDEYEGNQDVVDDDDLFDDPDERVEILEEIGAAIAEEYEKNGGGRDLQDKSFYRARGRTKPSVFEMSTIALGDLASRHRIPRRGVDAVREHTQTHAAAAVREVLENLRQRRNLRFDIAEDEIDDITNEILTARQYKPGDGRAFYEILKKRTGFSSHVYDCCIKSCVSYAAYPDAEECPLCKHPRWKPPAQLPPDTNRAERTNKEPPAKIPYKTHVYYPIRHRILLWYSSSLISQLLKTYRRKASATGVSRGNRKLTDWWSGSHYIQLRNDKDKFGDSRDLAFCMGFDGTKAFKSRTNRYLWPIVLTCLNLPPQIRYKRRNIIIAGFVPGPDNPKEPDSFLKPLVDEMEFLSKKGHVGAWDAGAGAKKKKVGEEFVLKAHLVLISTDMQARISLLHTMGLTSISFCEYCHMKGLNYGGMHAPHKPPDNLQSHHPWVILDQKEKRDGGRVCYNWEKDYTNDTSQLRTDRLFRKMADAAERNEQEFANPDPENPPKTRKEIQQINESTGIKGKSIFMRLDTISFPMSFPPCTMHLFFENVVQHVFEHFAGRFFVNRPAPAADPAKPNEPPQPSRKPKFYRRQGKDEAFLPKTDSYNIAPQKWVEIGEDSAHSNQTYPDQLGEHMPNLIKSFRRMKAANWKRFVFHQSPVYFRKHLPELHYKGWMNLVEGMRLATRNTLDINEVNEIRERFFQFVEYYEQHFYQYDADRIAACQPSIHQLRHVHEAILFNGPSFAYAQWSVERVNGMITSSIKSRQKPDENIGNIIEIDAHINLLPYVIPGLETLVSKRHCSDQDGRLLLHKVFRKFVINYNQDDAELDENSEDETQQEPNFQDPTQLSRQKPVDPKKLHPTVLESFLTSTDIGIDELEAEFGQEISTTDIRRALLRIGDVILVDRVKVDKGCQILNGDQLKALIAYIQKHYSNRPERKGDIPALFEANPPLRRGQTGMYEGRHSTRLRVAKFRNVRYENKMKLGSADHTVDTRVVRICGSMYPRSNRVRSASFFEYSSDIAHAAGAATVGGFGNYRSASSRSTFAREFGEARFFASVDIDWPDGINQDGTQKYTTDTFYLAFAAPISVRKVDGLTIVNRVPPALRTSRSPTNNRLYKTSTWIDVEDFVDIVGLIYCSSEEYICWRDGSWDPVARSRTCPLRWKFGRQQVPTGPRQLIQLDPNDLISSTSGVDSTIPSSSFRWTDQTSGTDRADRASTANEPDSEFRPDSLSVHPTSSSSVHHNRPSRGRGRGATVPAGLRAPRTRSTMPVVRTRSTIPSNHHPQNDEDRGMEKHENARLEENHRNAEVEGSAEPPRQLHVPYYDLPAGHTGFGFNSPMPDDLFE